MHTINFLEHEEEKERIPPPRVHRHRFRRMTPVLFLLFLLVLVGYLLLAALGAGRVLSSSLQAREELEAAQAFATELKFEEAEAALTRAQSDVAAAEVGLVLLTPLRVIPWVGDQVRGTDAVLEASQELILALKDVVVIAADVIEVVNRAQDLSTVVDDTSVTYLDLSPETRRDLLNRLHQSLPDLERISVRLDLAIQDVAALDELDLAAPLSAAVQPFRTLLPELKATVDLLIPVAAVLPEFAGLDGARTFLVLYENNTELRPGGGFIGTYGNLVVQDGKILALDTEDSYAVGARVQGRMPTTPPVPLAQYVGVDAWYFRDANWSPDFSVSAEKALELMATERSVAGVPPVTYDGVIGITPTLAADLLTIVGPITIDGQTFTAENIAETLEYQVEFGFAEDGLPREQRKEIVGALTEELVTRLERLPLSSLGPVIEAAKEAAEEKQLLFFSLDTETQSVLETSSWAGKVLPSGGDTLMVVDANMASLKTDPAVARDIVHRVRREESGRLIAETSVTYTHLGSFDWKTTRYRTYTRVYVPLGSTLLQSSGTLQNDLRLNPSGQSGTVEVGEELGLAVFGAFTSVEPGASQTLSFTYELPESLAELVDAGTYDLRVLKQPGAYNHDLTVDADFGTPLTSASPSESPDQFGDEKYFLNTNLDQDMSVAVRF